jgi:hypothetical protein
MSHTDDRRLTTVWALLVAATGLSWLLAGHHDSHGSTVTAGAAIALGLGFVKVRYIGREFIEVRNAPALLQRILDAWILSAGTTLIVLYVTG